MPYRLSYQRPRTVSTGPRHTRELATRVSESGLANYVRYIIFEFLRGMPAWYTEVLKQSGVQPSSYTCFFFFLFWNDSSIIGHTSLECPEAQNDRVVDAPSTRWTVAIYCEGFLRGMNCLWHSSL